MSNQQTVLKMITDYQQGVVNVLTEGKEDLPVIDMQTGRFGLTNLTIKGEQYLIFSALKDVVDAPYPKAEDIAANIVGVKINDIRDINLIESWLTIIKAQFVSQAAMSNVVQLPEEEQPKPEAKTEPAPDGK